MKFKTLELSNITKNTWIAESPARHNNEFKIMYEHNKFWAIWDCLLPAMSLVDLQAIAQKEHEEFLMQFMD